MHPLTTPVLARIFSLVDVVNQVNRWARIPGVGRAKSREHVMMGALTFALIYAGLAAAEDDGR
jgi:hypothetical protein